RRGWPLSFLRRDFAAGGRPRCPLHWLARAGVTPQETECGTTALRIRSAVFRRVPPGREAMPTAINRTMTPGAWSLLVFLAGLWGGSFFYVGVAIKVLSPVDIVAFRVGLGALLLYLVVRLLGARMPRDRATWGAFFIMAIANNVIPFNLIAWAQGHVASG